MTTEQYQNKGDDMTHHDTPNGDILGRTTAATAVGGVETIDGVICPLACVSEAAGDVCFEVLGKDYDALWFTPTEAIELALDLILTVDEIGSSAHLRDRDIAGLTTLRGAVERAIEYGEARDL